MHTAEQLLSALGRHSGLPDAFAFDHNRCARIIFDETVAVTLEASIDDGPLHVYSVLGALPDGNREAILLKLMNANLFGADTAGATLAIDGTTDEIVICRQVNTDQATEWGFISMIDQFVAAVEVWTAKLSDWCITCLSTQPEAAECFSGW